MKSHLIVLLTLGIVTNCFGMEKEELKKSIILSHKGSVNTIHVDHTKTYLFLSLKSKEKNSIEVYDINKKKAIKTIKNEQEKNAPILNEYFPGLIAYGYCCEKNTYCSLLNLKDKNIVEKKNAINNFNEIKPEFLLNGTLFLMPSLNKNRYNLIEWEKDQERSYAFGDDLDSFNYEIETCIKSPDKKYLVFCLQNGEAHLHNVKTNEIKDLSTKKLSPIAYNQNSTFLTFFTPDTKKITLYDLEKYTASELCTCESNRMQNLFFINNQMLLFSHDSINYALWDITKTKPLKLELESAHCLPDQPLLHHGNYLAFQLWKLGRTDIYDIETQALNTLYGGIGIDFVMNAKNTHALLSTTNNGAALYETDDWELITTFSFTNGHLNPHIAFSPCGTFALVMSRNKKGEPDQLQMYDILKEKIVLQCPWKEGLSANWVEYYQNDKIIFAVDSTTLMVYDYKNDVKKKISTKEAITQFAVKEDLLAISFSNQETYVMYYLTELELIDYEIPKIQLIKISEKEEKKDSLENKNLSIVTFYGQDGKLVETKKDGSTCLIL